MTQGVSMSSEAIAAVVSAAAAVAAIIVAVNANRRADRAIEKADTANSLSAESNGIAKDARDVARDGNALAMEANRHSEEAVGEARGANALAVAANRIAQESLDAQRRVDVRIIEAYLFSYLDDEVVRAGVRIVNLSAFPVWISKVWWMDDSEPMASVAFTTAAASGSERATPALRLEPREVAELSSAPDASKDEVLRRIVTCEVETTCGVRVRAPADGGAVYMFGKS